MATTGHSYAQQLRKKVGANPTIILPSAALEVESTKHGFLPPRMTQAQMQAISSPATGLMVYCTNCSSACLQMYNGSTWVALCSGSGMTADCDGNGFVGNYIKGFAVSSGATFSTTLINNTFAAATINFAASDLVLSGVAGLSVGTPTPSTATLSPGQSQQVSYPITGTPTSTGTLTGTWSKLSLSCFNTKEVACGAYTAAGDFLVFQCHNLGADETVYPFTPSWKLNGAYIQWGKRGPTASWQGAANDGASGFAAAPTLATANDGAISGWIPTLGVAADGSWNVKEASPVKTGNDPCPAGYRVPTRNEWKSITGWSNVAGATWVTNSTNYSSGKMVGSDLYLPAAGYREISDGSLSSRGYFGDYWSSTENGSSNAYHLYFDSSNVISDFNSPRNYGLSVRCIKE